MTEDTMTKGSHGGSADHVLSTITLCACAFVHSYLLISVFPYSGFMAIDLIPYVNEESAGSYAGLIASSFMLGRSISSYGWGKVADIYGRTFVLFWSLLLSLVFSLLFGLSTSFPLALFWRFLLGLVNGILGTTKTVVSELAHGDEKLEAKAMGLVVAMWGCGFLICPVISGALSEPVRQYPSLLNDEESGLYRLLDSFPFFLPNLVGALMCFLSMILLHLFVTETLPENQTRDVKYLAGDIVSSIRSIVPGASETGERSLLAKKKVDHGARYGAVETDVDILSVIEEDIGEAIRESIMSYDEEPTLLSGEGRRSLVGSVTRRASLDIDKPHRFSEIGAPQQATIASLWASLSTRNHMIVYWIASFMSSAVDEGFPLFCISKEAGLGLTENTIGAILSVSGLLFVILQYSFYSALVESLGISGTIQVTALTFGPIVALIPLSLLLNHGQGYDDLTGGAFSYLGCLLALFRLFFLAFFSSIIVALNRSVEPAHRATMNGLATLGGSVAKCVGPSFAGLLASFSLSSGVFQPQVGAAFMWIVLGGVGVGMSLARSRLLKED